jgi:hypothetical protein
MKRRLLISTLSTLAVAATGALSWSWLRKRQGSTERRSVIQTVFSQALPPLSAQHLQLIRLLRVQWMPIESGHPASIPCSPLAAICPPSTLPSKCCAVTILLWPPGSWPRSAFGCRSLWPPPPWRPVAMPCRPTSGQAPDSSFDFRPEHLTLLHAALWREVGTDDLPYVLAEEEDGQAIWPLPYIDGKRPYGDRSYYQIDMADILGKPYARNAQGQYILPPQKDEALKQLHLQTQAALQILLMHGTPSGIRSLAT